MRLYKCEWNIYEYYTGATAEMDPFYVIAENKEEAVSKARKHMDEHYDDYAYEVYEVDEEVIS